MGDVNVAHPHINISVQSVTNYPVPSYNKQKLNIYLQLLSSQQPPSCLRDKLPPGIFSIEPLHLQIVFLSKLLVEVWLDAPHSFSGNIHEGREMEVGEGHGCTRIRLMTN